eukprot:15262316-Ditylum_brightwellii.AAC.1
MSSMTAGIAIKREEPCAVTYPETVLMRKPAMEVKEEDKDTKEEAEDKDVAVEAVEGTKVEKEKVLEVIRTSAQSRGNHTPSKLMV